jgi:chloramphenicol 3-O phosphotransferase
VVILNGASSAGKSTILRMFIEQRATHREWWLPVAIDDFQAKILPEWAEVPGHRGPFSEEGVRFEPSPEGTRVRVGERARRLYAAYHRFVAVCSKEGFDVVVDEVAFDEETVHDWREALAGLSVTWVAVRCDPDVAEAREQARGLRVPGLARWLSSVVHEHALYDLDLDSTNTEPATLVEQLTSFLFGPEVSPQNTANCRARPSDLRQ